MARRRRRHERKFRFGSNGSVFWKYCPECGKRNGLFAEPKDKCECGAELSVFKIDAMG